LEETYAKWQVQSVTISRYTHFPPQTNLTEIVDKTEIQEEGILDFYNPQREDEEDQEMMDVNPATSITDGNVQSSYTQSEKKTPAPPSSSARLLKGLDTPISEPMRTPGSGRRKAAENAITKLHNEVMPDLLLWEKEKKRKRIPEEPVQSHNEEVEKKKKIEKRRIVDDKENDGEIVNKKAKKELESVKNIIENKVTLLVTGASEDLTSASSIKVRSSKATLTRRNYLVWELNWPLKGDIVPI
jgi:hypothetical protein